MFKRPPKPATDNGALRLVVVAGGTGGHLFPGIAIAQALIGRFPDCRVLFIGTDRPFEAEAVADAGFDHRAIRAAGLKGRGLARQAGALAIVPQGVAQAVGLLGDFAPHLVLGMGGYSAGAVGLAAWLLGIPRALHEQNRLPGLTNRLLGRIADRVYLSFEQSQAFFRPDRTRLTGNPVRPELLAVATDSASRAGKNRTPPFALLVFGGSQGAHRINMAVVAALSEIKADGIAIVHQTGDRDEAMVRKAYAAAGVVARVAPFFKDMAALYHQADLVICRAGATTVAEITAMGKAALFVPFPFAADDHQTANARTLVEAGAGDMIAERDLTGTILAQRIDHYRKDPAALWRMAKKAKALGRPEAAETIVDDLLALLAEKGRPRPYPALRL
ncbi:MAG: undecaprenyldiphospho-muramoylpentapeptide beta-N-acetylglucosaminyltransferase [Desulfobacterales bacterium]|nr:undecaprenyldiphospho-muramoylpentapeptide beta-N-acetylglucosaminyltransferase [Desulfobacterales bacterium]